MYITADHREKKSGLIELLEESGFHVEVKTLAHGDYLFSDDVVIERKTAHDLIVSIIDGRLFSQIAAMKKIYTTPLLLIEGNPFLTNTKMDRRAIRGAILSIQVVWYIPVIYTKNIDESCTIIKKIFDQLKEQKEEIVLRHGYRPKRLKNLHLFILQGFPGVGAVMAKRLLDRFGTIRNVMNASGDDLMKVEGVGAKMAERIIRTIN